MSTPKAETSSHYKLTPEEMWTCVRGTSQNWGIEGYEVPRNYFDFYQARWVKEREQIKKEHKSLWPPKDWPKSKEGDTQIPPRRINFIDEVVKHANSYNDEAKSKERYEQLAPKGIFEPPKKKEIIDVRKKFLDEEKDKKEKMAALPKIQEWKVSGIEKAQEQIKEDEAKKKTETQKNIEKYTKDKPQWPRCDRVTIVADAEYVGETIPFYNTFTKEGESVDKNKLFFPKKDFTWNRAPIWTFDNKKRLIGQNDQMKARDSAIQEKVNNYISAKNLKDSDLRIDVDRAEKLIMKRGRYPLTFYKPTDYANEEHYKNAREQHPEYSPDPCHYWKMKPGTQDTNTKPIAAEPTTLPGGKEGKIYYLNHKRNDHVIYKPMRGSVF